MKLGPRMIALIALTALAAQSGCAHYYLPASQLESPETVGPDRIGRLELVGIQSGTDLLTAPTKQAADPTTGTVSDPVLSSSLINYAFGVTLAVTPVLDVGIKLEPFAPLLARAKYQFIGDPESKAHVGNLSLSASGSGGLLLARYNANGVTFYSFNAAVIGGYRLFEHHLFSLAPFFNLAGISGIDPASGSATLYGASLGYQYDAEALILRGELTWASGSVSQSAGSANAGGFFPGLLIGFKL
jgi:hypothetical protein